MNATRLRNELVRPDTTDLVNLLANRRWQRRLRPFPHVVAENVFNASFAEKLTADFSKVLDGAVYDSKHDFTGTSLVRGQCGALEVFLSPEWLSLAAGLFDVRGSCYLTGGVHRHQPGGRNGFPHNDIHPEKLKRTTVAGEVLAGSRAGGDGDSAQFLRGSAVRAVAMLYYLGDARWSPGDGGETGLYWDWKDPTSQPVSRAAPRHNSLFAFACNPHSYHSFMANRRRRDSIIVFLYQALEQYLGKWGEEGLQQYAEYGGRDV